MGKQYIKIDIVGSVASGKTTLAKNISKKYSVPYYEKDNVVWKRTKDGDIKINIGKYVDGSTRKGRGITIRSIYFNK